MGEIKKNKRIYINEWFQRDQIYKEGDTLVFEMPPFCSGDYSAKIYLDNDGDPYIKRKDNYMNGCRTYWIYSSDKEVEV